MANHCRICSHPQLRAINERLINGESMRNISEDFGMAESSVFRHKRDHLPKALMKAMDKLKEKENTDLATIVVEQEQLQLTDSVDLIKRINFLIAQTEDIYAVAREGKQNLNIALKSLDSLRGTYQFCVTMGAQMEATIQAKIELERLQRGDDKIAASEEFEDSLKNLSFNDLVLISRIDKKRRTNNGDNITDGYQIFPSKDDIDNIVHDD
jgi:hypothetical protein